MVLSSQLQLSRLPINRDRLLNIIDTLHTHIFGEQNSFSTEMDEQNKLARDYFVSQAKALNLKVEIDRIGNIKATRKGTKDLPPVAIGGHLDASSYQQVHGGSLSLSMGLEIIKVLNENNTTTKRPISIISFTNTEGKRFTPNLLGSLVYSNAVPLEEMLCVASKDTPKVTLSKELKKKKYLGKVHYKYKPLHSFVEIQTEAFINKEDSKIGLIEGIYGTYWTEYHLAENQNITQEEIQKSLLKISKQYEGLASSFEPVFHHKNLFLLDLKHYDARVLNSAQISFDNFLQEKLTASVLKTIRKESVRLAPIPFEEGIVEVIENIANNMNLKLPTALSYKAVNAQIMIEKNHVASIYVPCLSKNHQSIINIENGTKLLLHSVLELTKT